MSTVNKKPTIAKIIDAMNSTEIAFLESVMDTKEHKNSTAFGNLPEHHDICMAVIQNSNYKPLVGVLWNTRSGGSQIIDDYYLIDLFTNGEYVNIYHIVDDVFERIREQVTLLEVRFWLKGGKGAQIVRLQYDKSTLGEPNNERVTQFVKDSGYQKEDEWGNILVIVKPGNVSWSYIQVSAEPLRKEWVGGGSDIVTPFDNTTQGTIVGDEHDGYVEHLASDSAGVGHVHGWDKKLDKLTTTSGLKAYIRNGSTDTSMDLVQTNTTGNTIPVRTSTGTIRVGDAVDNKDAVNKGQLDNYLPLDGSKAMTGNIDMNNHIINMKGAKIANLGAGSDDDAISKGKAKELFVNKKITTDDKTYAYAFTKDGQTEVDVSSIGKVKDVQEKQVDGSYSTIVGSDGVAKFNSIDKLNKKSTTDDKVYSYGYDKTDKEKGIEIVSDYTENSKNKIASAYQTNDLNTRIANVESIGRSLSGWNCRTGKASTAPTTLPYTYKTGDYFTVQVIDQDSDYPAYEATQVYNVGDKCKYDSKYYICKIATTGTFDPTKWDEHNITNYRPYGTSYSDIASTVVETGTVAVNDTYRFDGTNWILFHTTGNYLPAHDGVGTGTTKLENIIISGDSKLHDLQVIGDADFVNPITIADAGGVDEAVSLGQLNKRILDLSAAPTTTTVGIKGQLAFARDTAKLYHCTAADDVASAYTWEEFTGGGSIVVDGKTIKLNASGQAETTIGGWKETTPEIKYANKSSVTAESGTTVELYKVNSKLADFVENANVTVKIGYSAGTKVETFTAIAKTQPITIAGVEADYLAVKMPTADIYLAYVKFDGVTNTLCVVDKLGIGMSDPDDYVTAYTPATSTIHYVNNEYILVDGTTITVDATTGALKASGGSGAEIVILNGNFTSTSAVEFNGTITVEEFNKLKEGKALCVIKIPLAADVYLIVSVNTRIYDPSGTSPIITATAEYADATNINNVFKYALKIDGNAKTFVGRKLSSSNFKYLRKDGAAVGSNDEFEGTLTDSELTDLASAETLFELRLTDTNSKLWYVPINTRVFDADGNVSGAVFKYDPITKAQVKFAFTVAPNGGADTTFHLSKVDEGGTSIQFDNTIKQNSSTGLYGTVIGGYDEAERTIKDFYIKNSSILNGSTSTTDGSYKIVSLEKEITESIGTLKVVYYNNALTKELTWEGKPQLYDIEIGGVTSQYLAVKSSDYNIYVAKVPFGGGTDPEWCLVSKESLLSVDVNKDYISAYTQTVIPSVKHYINNEYVKIGSGLKIGALGELDTKIKQDDSSIIVDSSNKYAVSYGGSYKETRIEVIKGYTLGDKIDENLYKMTSAESTGVTELPKGIRIVGTIVYDGDEIDIDEVVQSAEFTGVDPSITYSGNRIMLTEVEPDVFLYFGQLLDHPDTPFVFYCESGDITTYLANLTSIKLNELVISSTSIKANVIPINEDFMKIESGGIMPLYDDEVMEFATVAPTGDAVYNELNKINVKIPEDASATNQLVDEATADQKIALVEARQLYKTNAQGSFATKAELLAATTFYKADGTAVTPNLNDIAYVLADETRSNKTAKYTVASLSPIVWGFVIAFTDLQLTAAQQNALNSGITSAKVTQYNNYASNKVSKAGDTMTGDLNIKKSDPILYLWQTGNDGLADIRHIDKNSVMQSGIRFRTNSIEIGKKATTGENWWNGSGATFYQSGEMNIHSASSDGATKYAITLTNNGDIKTGMAIVHSANDGHVVKSDYDTKSMWISGGTSIDTGSSIRLSGNSNINKGTLTFIAASSGSNRSVVILRPSGNYFAASFPGDSKEHDVCVQTKNTVELWKGSATSGTVDLSDDYSNYSAVILVGVSNSSDICTSYFPAPIITSTNELLVSGSTTTPPKYLRGLFKTSKTFTISGKSYMTLIGIYGLK